MLDHVERRAFLVQPARKDPLARPVRLRDVELDEGAGEPFILPWRSGVAGAQADHRVAHADRLPGPKRKIADDAVAFVEQPEHRDSLAHRRHPGDGLDRPGHIDGDRLGAIDGLIATVGAAIAARAERQRQQGKAADQDYSGFQA